MPRRYALITPCRDEAAHLRTTLETVGAQTVPPAVWVIVDDGSTDDTPKVLAEAQRQWPYIRVLRRENRGRRAVGPGVIEAFYDGLSSIRVEDYDYVCKLDGDLALPPRYFERLMEECEKDPWLGTVSGKPFVRYGDRLVEERCGDENSIGPTKFYRVDCFQDIGGFVREVCWDGIDGHVCRMKGWVARSLDDPELRVLHLRQMGSSQKNVLVGRMRWGRGKYYMGSAWYYVAAVSVYRMFERPWVIGGLALMLGYIRAAMERMPRHGDAAYRKWLRRYELRSLLTGKRRTMHLAHERVRRDFPPRERSPAAPGSSRQLA